MTKLVARFILLSFWCWTSVSGSQQPLISFLNIPPEDSFAPNYILDIAQDDQGFLWFASLSGGLARFDGYDFKTYQYTPGDPNSLPSNQINRVYVDPQGGIWLATPEGLVWLDTDTDRITVYRHDPNDPGSLIYSFIGSILRDSRGDLWVGTEKGLSRKVAGANTFTNYSMVPDDHKGGKVALPPTWVWDIFEDSYGQVWFGMLGGGLVRFDPDTEEFTRYVADPEDPGKLPHSVVRTIFEDSSGTLWVGTDHGLAVLEDRSTGRFRRVELLDKTRDGAPRPAPVWDIEQDSFGNLWFSTVTGGALRLAGSETFHYFAHEPGDLSSLGPGKFWKIYLDHTGTVWFATDVIGRVVPSSLAFSQFPAPKTIRNDEVNLLVDSEGVIWFGLEPAKG